MTKIKNSRKLIIMLIIIGAIGTVVFCPIKMQSGGTCLFHRLLGEETHYLPDQTSSTEKANLMLRRYLVPFGFAWWISLGLFVLSWYQFKVLGNKPEEQL